MTINVSKIISDYKPNYFTFLLKTLSGFFSRVKSTFLTLVYKVLHNLHPAVPLAASPALFSLIHSALVMWDRRVRRAGLRAELYELLSFKIIILYQTLC